MEGSIHADATAKTAMESTEQSTTTPTVNDNSPGRGKVGREENAKKGVEDPLHKPEQPMQDATSTFSPSLSNLPAELISAIFRDNSLLTLDRARCCLLSRTFLPLAREALHRHIALELQNPYSEVRDWVVLDRHNRKTLATLADHPQVASQVREFSLHVVDSPEDGWDLEHGPEIIAELADFDAAHDLNDEEDAVERMDIIDFDLILYLELFLRATPRLESLRFFGDDVQRNYEEVFARVALPHLKFLRIPRFPLHLAPSFPRLTHLRATRFIAREAPLPSAPLAVLRHLDIRGVDLEIERHLDTVLATLNSLTYVAYTHKFSHRPSRTPKFAKCLALRHAAVAVERPPQWDTSRKPNPIRLPSTVTTVEILPHSQSEILPHSHFDETVKLDPAPFLSTLPSSIRHLRIDPQLFHLPQLLAFLRSPSNLPELASVAVVQTVWPTPMWLYRSPAKVEAKAAGEEADECACEAVLHFCIKRGLEARLEVDYRS